MQSKPHKKAGYTLVELLAVISIIGVLSGMGVVGFQKAVENARAKDASINVTAYMEMVANKARQINKTLCIRRSGHNKLVVHESSCDAANPGASIDSLVFDVQDTIIEGDGFGGLEGFNLVSSQNAKASFVPRPGLSAAPYEGYVVVRHGDLHAAAVKEKTRNIFKSKLKTSDGWLDL